MRIIIELDDSISRDEAEGAIEGFLEEPWCYKAYIEESGCGSCGKCAHTTDEGAGR